jgi:hypothetical protein
MSFHDPAFLRLLRVWVSVQPAPGFLPDVPRVLPTRAVTVPPGLLGPRIGPRLGNARGPREGARNIEAGFPHRVSSDLLARLGARLDRTGIGVNSKQRSFVSTGGIITIVAGLHVPGMRGRSLVGIVTSFTVGEAVAPIPETLSWEKTAVVGSGGERCPVIAGGVACSLCQTPEPP